MLPTMKSQGKSCIEPSINDSYPFPDLIREGSVQQALALLPYIPNILLKLGSHGVLCVRLCPKNSEISYKDGKTLQSKGVDVDVIVRYYPGLKHDGIVSVTGAGYCLIQCPTHLVILSRECSLPD
jgi:hypothetical protein